MVYNENILNKYIFRPYNITLQTYYKSQSPHIYQLLTLFSFHAIFQLRLIKRITKHFYKFLIPLKIIKHNFIFKINMLCLKRILLF